MIKKRKWKITKINA